MSTRITYWIAAIVLIILIGVLLVRPDSSSLDRAEKPGVNEEGTQTPQDLDPESSGSSTSDDSIQLAEVRERHGYYASGSGDINSKHPYELYDVETLAQLADQDDGMAQIVLADKLVATDPERADALYWQAAINGKTAALVNVAASHLVLVPGGTGFGFEPETDDGEVSSEYADVLAYYAAAEDLGDPVATELLRAHMDDSQFSDSADSIIRICEEGLAIADKIRAERITKWGNEEPQSSAAPELDSQEAICSNIHSTNPTRN